MVFEQYPDHLIREEDVSSTTVRTFMLQSFGFMSEHLDQHTQGHTASLHGGLNSPIFQSWLLYTTDGPRGGLAHCNENREGQLAGAAESI